MAQHTRSTKLIITDNDGEKEEYEIVKDGGELSINGDPIELIDINDFDEDQRNIYQSWENNNKELGLLKASLYYFPYGDTIEGDASLMELMDTLILRVTDDQSELSNIYQLTENCLTIPSRSHKFYLPTTGSGFAETDFPQEIDNLHKL